MGNQWNKQRKWETRARGQEQQRDQETVVGAGEVLIVGSKEEPEDMRTIRRISKWEEGPGNRGTRYQPEGTGTIHRDKETEESAKRKKQKGLVYWVRACQTSHFKRYQGSEENLRGWGKAEILGNRNGKWER